MARYEVVVGNVGTVYVGDNEASAQAEFDAYCAISKQGYGRVGGECVTLIKDGEIRSEYGTLRED